ncbi:MAG: magnesium transporter [Anaerolineaceae bacterium]|jgi:CBS domain-containing protein/sporulation protein YlmC with PRC-barrel domain|nr:MAG: magnesium transporter [Anaerolineaceae bacterium]
MFYLSEILDKKVWDRWGKEIGKCRDILTGFDEKVFHQVIAVEIKEKNGNIKLVSSESISSLFPNVTINRPAVEITPYIPKGNELYLKKQVLDHQIVDVEGKRVVRVNDIQIAYTKDAYFVTGVDVGNAGLLRRLGFQRINDLLGKLFKNFTGDQVISWKDVAYVEEKDPLRLKTSQEKISKLPPADIASILNDLDRMTGQSLLQKMGDEILADTLEESPSRFQIDALSTMDSERAADILEEMEPDEAADLIASLPRETSTVLLDLMEKDEADDIRSLLDYPPDSAGGIMTTEFGWIPKGLTADEAIAFLRSSEDAQEVEDMYYIYVLDEKKCLVGEIYLRDLVMADPTVEVESLMNKNPISVSPLSSQEEIAYLAAKYNLLSIPVVDRETGFMQGIVTLDDALDAVLPTAYKKRLPRFF